METPRLVLLPGLDGTGFVANPKRMLDVLFAPEEDA